MAALDVQTLPAADATRGRTLEREPRTRKRKYLWDPPFVKTFIPGTPSLFPVVLSKHAHEAFLIRARLDEICHKLITGQLDIPPESERSPSPEPIYDSKGKRTNTREGRARERLQRERQRLVEKAQKLNPMFRSPSDWSKGQTTKKQRKLYIPVDKYPNYNFIGLIIGPRGITQKKLEKETGAKISIRGKGSEKEGKAQKNQEGMDEPLHVLITGDTDEAVEAASVVISKLLVPVDDTKNEHKRAQLRTLAEMNGTVSQSQAWRNNPDLNPQLQTGVQVQCALCGEVSHPTKDCPLKNQAGVRSRLDSELERFFEEVGEKRPSDSASATASADADADAAYAAFMSEVSGVASQPARPAAAAPTPSATAASSSAPPASAAAAAAAPPPWQQQTQQAQQARPPAPPAAAAPPPWQQAPWQQQQQQQGAYAAPWMAPMPGYPYAGVPMPPMPGYPLMPGMYAPPMQPMQPMQGQMPARPGLLPTPPAGARPT